MKSIAILLSTNYKGNSQSTHIINFSLHSQHNVDDELKLLNILLKLNYLTFLKCKWHYINLIKYDSQKSEYSEKMRDIYQKYTNQQ